MIKFSNLPDIIEGNLLQFVADLPIEFIVTDSRRTITSRKTLFFARRGPAHDGHLFLSELYNEGIRNFIVEKSDDYSHFKEANFIKVESSIDALQKLVVHHRKKFSPEVIGITGSNGKTIVKEWLLQLLSVRYRIVATPHSYNSQLGVPLSVWQLNENHDLGIFEAGISQRGEMENLERIIKPTVGIFTNIGPAHDQGFESRREKILEKMKLFVQSRAIIFCKDHKDIDEALSGPGINTFSWGQSALANLRITSRKKKGSGMAIRFFYNETDYDLDLPVSDLASAENLLHCITCMLYLGFSWEELRERIGMLIPVAMRLELKKGINGCYIIDDSYNNDIGGLKIALDLLRQQKQRSKKTVILSDIFQAGIDEGELYGTVNNLLNQYKISQLIGVGPQIIRQKEKFDLPAIFFSDTNQFLRQVETSRFNDQMILVKGARAFTFERIVNRLQERIHGTRLEINLGAITHNLNFFRSRLKRRTKLMVMVKAFAYGTGMYEIANLLQYHKVDYLGVAYTDEGVNLRNNGIFTPIMIMNPSPEGYEQLLNYDLEPEVYGFQQLDSLLNFLQGRPLKIHLKVDTGMHRLGFQEQDIQPLIDTLIKSGNLNVKSIFSHLAAADETAHENFSRFQARIFKNITQKICNSLKINPICHFLNSAGIISYPEYQFDMVRLGIGLYGIEPTGLFQGQLLPVSTLRTIISQIREVAPGSTIGYGRKGKAEVNKRIATIAIGYADGFSRFFSNGKGEVIINGKRASVVGNVCMDMTMVDITDIEASEGDDVIVFGESPTINELADSIGTIPYEILTSVSERVKRVYVYD